MFLYYIKGQRPNADDQEVDLAKQLIEMLEMEVKQLAEKSKRLKEKAISSN